MTLGFGRRLVIWLQGCTIGCDGCMSPETWSSDTGEWVHPSALASAVLGLVDAERLDGVSLSGGEPTEQEPALLELMRCLQPARRRNIDLLLFSGVSASRLRVRHGALLALVDAVVAGPYRPARPSPEPLLASDNQQLLRLTALAEQRYPARPVVGRPRLQVSLEGDAVRLIGLPRPGDLERLTAALAVVPAEHAETAGGDNG